MLTVSLQHKSSVIHTVELANERSKVDIVIEDVDWTNAESMVKMLEPFASAVETMEGDHLGLAEVPCIMNVLNAHIEEQSRAFTSGPFHVAGEEMRLDLNDRWQRIPVVMKMAAALSARTKDLDWLPEAEQKQWRDLLVQEMKVLFTQDIAAETAADSSSAGGGDSGDVSGGAIDLSGSEPPKKQRLNFRTMAVLASRGAGRGSGGAGQTQETSPARPPSRLSLEARVESAEQELRRFVVEQGLNPETQQTSTDELSWWCRHQFSFPSLARLAVKYLVIPPSSAASERVFSLAGNIVTNKRNRLGDDTVDALVFLNGSHGLSWSSGISQKDLGRIEDDTGSFD